MSEIDVQDRVSPKHVFLHLFVIIVLYFSTINFTILLFQYTNYLIADPLSKTHFSELMFDAQLLRFAIASLVIVFPVFVLTSRYLNMSYARNPAIREMRTRKWLIYFTLFAASLIIIGDLVKIILTFLEGEMTLRFVLKASSILFVSGLIFYYYLCDLRKGRGNARRDKYFAWGVITVVGSSVIAGFFLIGSPKTERARRFDYERVSRLQEIQMQIINYWRSKERLPAKLADLEDKISGVMPPTDPETNSPFEYRVNGEAAFELCAVFAFDSEADETNDKERSMPHPGPGFENWKHGAGRTCFERVVDKELYPPYSQQSKKQ